MTYQLQQQQNYEYQRCECHRVITFRCSSGYFNYKAKLKDTDPLCILYYSYYISHYEIYIIYNSLSLSTPTMNGMNCVCGFRGKQQKTKKNSSRRELMQKPKLRCTVAKQCGQEYGANWKYLDHPIFFCSSHRRRLSTVNMWLIWLQCNMK